MGAIEDFCKTLGENAQRIVSGEDAISGTGQSPSFYQACLHYLDSLSEEEQILLYQPCIREFAGGSMKHRQWPIGEHEGHFVRLMLWLPGAWTRAHNHMGSPAWIRVLSGRVESRHYDMGSKHGDFKPHDRGIHTAGADIEEDARDIHAVGNLDSSTIAMTLHDFLGDAGVEVYAFTENLKWQAKPGESSKPGIPPDAVPIWTS